MVGGSTPGLARTPLAVSRPQPGDVEKVVLDCNGHQVSSDLDGSVVYTFVHRSDLFHGGQLQPDSPRGSSGVRRGQPPPGPGGGHVLQGGVLLGDPRLLCDHPHEDRHRLQRVISGGPADADLRCQVMRLGLGRVFTSCASWPPFALAWRWGPRRSCPPPMTP